jgi:hypothetical protein
MFERKYDLSEEPAGWWGGVQVKGPDRIKNFLNVIQTSSGAHAAFYPMGTVGSFPRAWSWPPSN